MLEVRLSGLLQSAANDVSVLEIEALTIRELMSKIADRYPKMNQYIDSGIAVAINGEIYRDNWEFEIPKDAEVFLLPRIQGG